VDHDERERIEHQLDLAERTVAFVKDETLTDRLKNYAEELRQRLVCIVRKPRIRARAYQLWEEAGQPAGRAVEFWLEAERQINEPHDAEEHPRIQGR
jgi:hypothetical protein